jgi:hypothetical protein
MTLQSFKRCLKEGDRCTSEYFEAVSSFHIPHSDASIATATVKVTVAPASTNSAHSIRVTAVHAHARAAQRRPTPHTAVHRTGEQVICSLHNRHQHLFIEATQEGRIPF